LIDAAIGDVLIDCKVHKAINQEDNSDNWREIPKSAAAGILP
jgi:hypothetical protein